MDNLTPEQITQMIALLQNMLPKQSNNTNTEERAGTETNDHISSIKTVNRKPVVSSINKFDEMLESKMHKEDIEIDKKLSKHQPTPRIRKFKPVNAKCRICGKQEEVSPSLLFEGVDRYKCNKCSGSSG
jgi:hypothetical protein